MISQNPNTVVAQNRQSNSTSILSFPAALGAHAISFNFEDYEFNVAAGKVEPGGVTASVVLPLPENLIDNYNVNISDYEFGIGGLAGAKGGNAFRNYIDGNTSEMNFSAEDVKSALKTYAVNVGIRGLDAIGDALPGIGNITSGVLAGAGVAINPYVSIIFKGMSLKRHQFSWNLMPRSQAESDTLNNIIMTFKKKLLPKYEFNKSLLQYPSVAKVFFLGSDPNYMYFFKPCMVSNFTFNYSGSGRPAFMKGGKPAAVTIQMELIETSIWTKDDLESTV